MNMMGFKLMGGFVWIQMYFPNPTFTAEYATMNQTFTKCSENYNHIRRYGGRASITVLGVGISKILVSVACPLKRAYIDIHLTIVYSLLFRNKMYSNARVLLTILLLHAFCIGKTKGCQQIFNFIPTFHTIYKNRI